MDTAPLLQGCQSTVVRPHTRVWKLSFITTHFFFRSSFVVFSRESVRSSRQTLLPASRQSSNHEFRSSSSYLKLWCFNDIDAAGLDRISSLPCNRLSIQKNNERSLPSTSTPENNEEGVKSGTKTSRSLRKRTKNDCLGASEKSHLTCDLELRHSPSMTELTTGIEHQYERGLSRLLHTACRLCCAVALQPRQLKTFVNEWNAAMVKTRALSIYPWTEPTAIVRGMRISSISTSFQNLDAVKLEV